MVEEEQSKEVECGGSTSTVPEGRRVDNTANTNEFIGCMHIGTGIGTGNSEHRHTGISATNGADQQGNLHHMA